MLSLKFLPGDRIKTVCGLQGGGGCFRARFDPDFFVSVSVSQLNQYSKPSPGQEEQLLVNASSVPHSSMFILKKCPKEE